MTKRALAVASAIAFSIFIVYIIVTADRGTCIICNVIKGFPYGDKAGHAGLYGMLVYLIALAYPTRRERAGWLSLYRTSAILAILITLEELLQWWFPDRTLDLGDLAASYVGVLVGDFFARETNKRRTA
jgi:VanZ family protein